MSNPNHPPFRTLLCTVVLTTLLGLQPPLHADQAVSEIDSLSQAGAFHLALRTLDLEQQRTQESATWLILEQQRYRLLEHTGDWDALLARTEEITDQVSRRDRGWVDAARARALLQLKRTEEANQLLLDLIWSDAGQLAEPQLSAWRQLIVRTNLATGRLNDAYVSMHRYRFDYGDPTPDARLLQARVLYRVGRHAAVVGALAEAREGEAIALRLAAELAMDEKHADVVIKTISETLVRDDLSITGQAALMGVAAEATRLREAWRSRSQALEAVLMRLPQVANRDDLIHGADGDELWLAYGEYGRSLGNTRQLLVGDDERWFNTARSLYDENRLAARALFAFLAQEGSNRQVRQLAEAQVGMSFDGVVGAEPILEALFVTSARYPSLEQVPEAVRHRLAGDSLSRGDIARATQLLLDLDNPPAGSDYWNWQVLRARVLIMGGQSARGVQALSSLLNRINRPEVAQRDRMLQVIFDLQALTDHTSAIELLQTLLNIEEDPTRRRELLYWMAESENGRGDPITAARLYLRSAQLPGTSSWDPWAQTARFHAATALAKGGFTEDARQILESLLARAESDKRRARIQREIDQLYLLERRRSSSG